jgi:carboxylesterase type B
LVKLLDSVVIYLEGGSELDLQILEQEALDKAEEKKADEAAKLEKDAKKEASDAAPKEASKTEDAMETDAKKEEGEKKETEDEKPADDEEKEDKKEDGADDDEPKAEAEKKPSLLDNLKSMKSQVHMPAFLSKKTTPKEKDPEAGDKDESKELLEKKEGDAEVGEPKEEEETAEDKSEKVVEESQPPASKGNVFLDSLRSVASHVPSIFKGKSTAKTTDEKDVEAGEKDELLEKKEGEKSDELEEVKVVSGDEEAPADAEKTDPEKPDKPYQKYLNQGCQAAKDAKDLCHQKYEALDRQKQLGVLGSIVLLLLILFIIILVAICTPSAWTNNARISEDGKFVTTHTICGPIKGLVEGEDQFSFKRIPYAVPVLDTDRWTHSTPMTTLNDCHEGTLEAHGHNDSGSCWRRYPSGAVSGDENCLTLDIFTSSVIYSDLKPVVVYVDGDDLSQEEAEALQPSAKLAQTQNTVFVSVNYRSGILGFLSLKSLSSRSTTKSSGNYGLGDIVSALKWIKTNIQHFGGHPSKVTILARGSGATLVTALTASPKAKDLFQQVWATNGAGVFQNKSLEMANTENKKIINDLNCGVDVVECLVDKTAEDIVEVTPYEWRTTNQPELPQKGENDHSWIIIDKNILLQHPKDYWTENQMSNTIPMVFGATAQGEVTADKKDFLDWTDSTKFEVHIESKLGSFNETLPQQVMDVYNVSDHWQEYASMISDIRTVCPLQELADYASKNFVANVFSYVATQPKLDSMDGIADKTVDVSAIFGTYQTEDESEQQFIANMQNMFYTYVKTGTLPKGKDMSLGMYVVNNEMTTQRSYPKCDFWEKAQDIVPNYASLD